MSAFRKFLPPKVLILEVDPVVQSDKQIPYDEDGFKRIVVANVLTLQSEAHDALPRPDELPLDVYMSSNLPKDVINAALLNPTLTNMSEVVSDYLSTLKKE